MLSSRSQEWWGPPPRGQPPAGWSSYSRAGPAYGYDYDYDYGPYDYDYGYPYGYEDGYDGYDTYRGYQGYEWGPPPTHRGGYAYSEALVAGPPPVRAIPSSGSFTRAAALPVVASEERLYGSTTWSEPPLPAALPRTVSMEYVDDVADADLRPRVISERRYRTGRVLGPPRTVSQAEGLALIARYGEADSAYPDATPRAPPRSPSWQRERPPPPGPPYRPYPREGGYREDRRDERRDEWRDERRDERREREYGDRDRDRDQLPHYPSYPPPNRGQGPPGPGRGRGRGFPGRGDVGRGGRGRGMAPPPPNRRPSPPIRRHEEEYSDSSSSSGRSSSSSSSTEARGEPFTEDIDERDLPPAPVVDHRGSPPAEAVVVSPYNDHPALGAAHTAGPNLVVGPIIGLVTGQTARVVIETPTSGSVTCTLSAPGLPPSHTTLNVRAKRPAAFAFSKLTPKTKYTVTIQGFTHVPSAFRTLPLNPTIEDRLSFALIACNKIRTTKETVRNPQGCVWRHLSEQCRNGQISMALHLGDQVYGDDDYEAMEQGKVSREVGMQHCMWAKAKALLERTPKQHWPAIREQVTEMYRDTYRETWGYPWTAHALANVPNIMQYDDHEIRDDFGDKPDEYDLTSSTRFIADCARRTIMEYQRQLMEDVDLSDPNSVPQLYNENHFHYAFGEYGLLFVDTRAARVFNHKPNDPWPFITSQQWVDIDRSLGPNGMFQKCKMLLFCTQIPMIFFGSATTEAIAKKADDFEGMWTYKNNIREQTRMLNSLANWKKAGNGTRSVALAGGDVHLGGYTETFKNGQYQFRQIIVGPISNSTLGMLAMAATNMIKEGGEALQDNWTYEHFKWTRNRNYGLIRVGPKVDPTDQEALSLVWSHIVSEGGRTHEVKTNTGHGKSKDGVMKVFSKILGK